MGDSGTIFSQVSERKMHWVRWGLTVAWLLLIASLLFDPWSADLTAPDHPWSPLRLSADCVQVQGKCLPEQPYPLGTTIFWGAVVPAAIFILLVFGHEVWRRICPLSFLSQIPRALGRQRQFRRENAKTGKVRYELAKVKPESWLGRNYSYVQFGWLFVGLCGRILFFNADRLVLASWILFTIAAAIAVGYLYGGKSWCNYFCPMAPVQKIYSEPGGLFASKAHISDQQITQSMCRTVMPDAKEQSACVACQNPCIDIDSERAYWEELNRAETTWLRYGYIGLVVGYFLYYYLYAGSWQYYFSGAWARQPNQLATLLDPGFYLAGQVIPIPKLVAVPLTLGISTVLGYVLGKLLEIRFRNWFRQRKPNATAEVIRHRFFTLCTFVIFNFFFIFGGRPLVQLLPGWGEYIYDLGLVLLSTLWVYKTWRRTPEIYSREGLASRFRKQLEKLQLNVSQFLEGRSLGDLNIHEVYVLAKVLPGFTKEKRHQAYKGVVRDMLAEGYVNSANSLQVLQQMRQELSITDDEHREVLEELGIEDPQLLNPDRQRSLENQIRLSGYRKSLERLMLLQRQQPGTGSFDQLLQTNSAQIRALRREYSITTQEEEWILGGLSLEGGNIRRAEYLLSQLPQLIASYRALHQPPLRPHEAVMTLLQESLLHKKELMMRAILQTLVNLGGDPAGLELARSLGGLASISLVELLEREDWRQKLPPQVLAELTQPGITPVACSLEATVAEITAEISPLLQDTNPLVQASCLYLIAQLNPVEAEVIARNLLQQEQPPLIQETAACILAQPTSQPLTHFPMLEKLVYLFNSDFFHRMHNETLIALADRAEVRTYGANAVITEEGDTCRELLLLMAGDAKIQSHLSNGELVVEYLRPGQTLDELEVLAHSESRSTIVAISEATRILAIPVDAFDDLLDRDSDFARRVLELESRQLQRFISSLQG